MNKEKFLRIDLFVSGIVEIPITAGLMFSEVITYSEAFPLMLGGIGLIYASSISRKVFHYE